MKTKDLPKPDSTNDSSNDDFEIIDDITQLQEAAILLSEIKAFLDKLDASVEARLKTGKLYKTMKSLQIKIEEFLLDWDIEEGDF